MRVWAVSVHIEHRNIETFWTGKCNLFSFCQLVNYFCSETNQIHTQSFKVCAQWKTMHMEDSLINDNILINIYMHISSFKTSTEAVHQLRAICVIYTGWSNSGPMGPGDSEMVHMFCFVLFCLLNNSLMFVTIYT